MRQLKVLSEDDHFIFKTFLKRRSDYIQILNFSTGIILNIEIEPVPTVSENDIQAVGGFYAVFGIILVRFIFLQGTDSRTADIDMNRIIIGDIIFYQPWVKIIKKCIPQKEGCISNDKGIFGCGGCEKFIPRIIGSNWVTGVIIFFNHN
jgi:hypothetical protein